MGLWVHILIVIFIINSFTIKKYIHTTPKGWKLWIGQKYDQKWQKWPKLCSVILHLGCLIDLKSLKRFWECQVFPSGLAWNHPISKQTFWVVLYPLRRPRGQRVCNLVNGHALPSWSRYLGLLLSTQISKQATLSKWPSL